jgi:hypothetical protein
MIPRQRSEGCLSDLKLDRLLLGELPEAAGRTAREHLASCPVCEQRHQLLLADRQSFATQAPAFEALLAPARGPGASAPLRPRAPAARRWLALALPAAALLALGVGLRSLLSEPGSGATSAPGTTRTKGSSLGFGYVVRREGRTFAGEPGQALHPGDVLRFTLSSKLPVHAGVWGIDESGASSYQTSPALALVGAGQRQPLPEAVELDQRLGEERLLLVACASAHPVVEIDAALAASLAAPVLPADCVSELLSVVKAAP